MSPLGEPAQTTMTIALVVITRNEERNISRCLLSAQGVADEIIVVDSGSSDRTVAIARSHGARVIQRQWTGYADQKNAANSLSACDYILSLDADEALSDDLRSELLKKKNELSGVYRINRLTNYCGKWIKHSGWYPDYHIRLFPREGMRWEGGLVHEKPVFQGNPALTTFKGNVYHYSYYSVEQHRQRADYYSSLKAKEMYASGKSASMLKPSLSAAFRWLSMFVFRLGFLDGKAGLTIASVSAASNYFKYSELRRLHRLSRISPPRVVAISRTDSIGDVVLTLPLAGIIKAQWPACRIVFIGKTYTEQVIRACRHIDDFFNFDEWFALGKAQRVNSLRGLNADAIIHVFPQPALAKAAAAAQIPTRIGNGRRVVHWLTCNKRPWFSRKNSALHEAQLNALLLRPLSLEWKFYLNAIPPLYGLQPVGKTFPEADLELAKGRKLIVLHPGSRGSAVEWGIANFASLCEMLDSSRYVIALTGTAAERSLIPEQDFPWNRPGVIDMMGKLSLSELMSFLQKADFVVAASTGPLHIASALGKNVVGLYSPKQPIWPRRWSPVGINASWITAPAHPSAGEPLEISPGEVYALIESRLFPEADKI